LCGCAPPRTVREWRTAVGDPVTPVGGDLPRCILPIDRCRVVDRRAGLAKAVDTYLDTGLFLDHRPMRAMVAETIAGRAKRGAGTRFLNLFAYTGSFTVHAAIAGAGHSTTVDLSNTYQAWTARNFAHNGIDAHRHVLVRADVLGWLVGAVATKQRYDVIVLDPPSFSNSKKMQDDLDVQRDHVRLVSQCHELLSAGGELFFSTNLRSFEIEPHLVQKMSLREITHQSVPEDFQRPNRRGPHRAWRTGI
jgi:23S rRNA (cytosine1962-C5)-methyltransferase